MKLIVFALACSLAGCSTFFRKPPDCEGELVPINVASAPAVATSPVLRFTGHAARSRR